MNNNRLDEVFVKPTSYTEINGGMVESKIKDIPQNKEWNIKDIKTEMLSKGEAILNNSKKSPYVSNPGSVYNPESEWVTWDNKRISYTKRRTIKDIGSLMSKRMYKSLYSNSIINQTDSGGNPGTLGFPGNGGGGNNYYTKYETEYDKVEDGIRDFNYYSMFGNPNELDTLPTYRYNGGRGLAMGESFIINPDFQFNELDDVRSDFRRPAIGRLYSERIYDYNLPKVIFQVGTVKINMKMISGLSALLFNNRSGKSLGDYLRDPDANFIKRLGMKLSALLGTITSTISTILLMKKRMYKFISDEKTYIKYVNEILVELSAWMGLGKFTFRANEAETIKSMSNDGGIDDEGKPIFSKNEQNALGVSEDGTLLGYGENENDPGIGRDKYAGKDGYLSVRNILPSMSNQDIKNANSWFSPYCVDIYIPFALTKGVNVSETFSNSTQENPIVSQLNSTGITSQEQVMIGQLPMNVNEMLDETASGGGKGLWDYTKGHLLTKGTTKIKSAITGTMTGEIGMVQNGTSRLILPEIWTDSSFDRSYNLNFKLFSPYGNRLSIFENTLVPLIFLISMTAPRQVGESSYTTPFCIKAFSKGLFSTNLGMVSSLSITRGDGKNDRTSEGFARSINVSMSIKDLMPRMTMSLDAGMWGILGVKNEGFRDYISFIAGVDLIDRSLIWNKFAVYLNVIANNHNFDAIKDNIRYYLSQSLPAKLITSPRSLFFNPNILNSLNSQIKAPSTTY